MFDSVICELYDLSRTLVCVCEGECLSLVNALVRCQRRPLRSKARNGILGFQESGGWGGCHGEAMLSNKRWAPVSGRWALGRAHPCWAFSLHLIDRSTTFLTMQLTCTTFKHYSSHSVMGASSPVWFCRPFIILLSISWLMDVWFDLNNLFFTLQRLQFWI